jgi:hypothetical protein
VTTITTVTSMAPVKSIVVPMGRPVTVSTAVTAWAEICVSPLPPETEREGGAKRESASAPERIANEPDIAIEGASD